MPSLFENAVSSIRMGVEDFQQQDGDRALSAVRNLYAGVLLLAKEVLVRQVPNANPKDVIGANFKPIPDGQGGVTYASSGQRTIDFDTVGKRFKDFGLSIDHKSLSDLNEIRNDIEHHYTDKTEASIRTSIAKAFPVVSSLFKQIDENPIDHLNSAWEVMLEQRELYDHELAQAKKSLANVEWHASFISGAHFQCSECGSELLEQIDPENKIQIDVEFHCKNCGSKPSNKDVITKLVDDEYGVDAYLRAKDGGYEDGPIYECPSCNCETYVEDEGLCVNCGEEIDYISECKRCSNEITIQDYLDGNDSGLCGYCEYQHEKIMRE